MKLGDLVRLYHFKHVFVDKFRHDIDWDIEFGCHEHGVELAVCVIEREEADPALVHHWVFTSPFEFGFLGILDEDGLFRIGDQIVLGLVIPVRESDELRFGILTIITPLGRPVVPLE